MTLILIFFKQETMTTIHFACHNLKNTIYPSWKFPHNNSYYKTYPNLIRKGDYTTLYYKCMTCWNASTTIIWIDSKTFTPDYFKTELLCKSFITPLVFHPLSGCHFMRWTAVYCLTRLMSTPTTNPRENTRL